MLYTEEYLRKIIRKRMQKIMTEASAMESNNSIAKLFVKQMKATFNSLTGGDIDAIVGNLNQKTTDKNLTNDEKFKINLKIGEKTIKFDFSYPAKDTSSVDGYIFPNNDAAKEALMHLILDCLGYNPTARPAIDYYKYVKGEVIEERKQTIKENTGAGVDCFISAESFDDVYRIINDYPGANSYISSVSLRLRKFGILSPGTLATLIDNILNSNSKMNAADLKIPVFNADLEAWSSYEYDSYVDKSAVKIAADIKNFGAIRGTSTLETFNRPYVDPQRWQDVIIDSVSGLSENADMFLLGNALGVNLKRLDYSGEFDFSTSAGGGEVDDNRDRGDTSLTPVKFKYNYGEKRIENQSIDNDGVAVKNLMTAYRRAITGAASYVNFSITGAQSDAAMVSTYFQDFASAQISLACIQFAGKDENFLQQILEKEPTLSLRYNIEAAIGQSISDPDELIKTLLEKSGANNASDYIRTRKEAIITIIDFEDKITSGTTDFSNPGTVERYSTKLEKAFNDLGTGSVVKNAFKDALGETLKVTDENARILAQSLQEKIKQLKKTVAYQKYLSSKDYIKMVLVLEDKAQLDIDSDVNYDTLPEDMKDIDVSNIDTRSLNQIIRNVDNLSSYYGAAPAINIFRLKYEIPQSEAEIQNLVSVSGFTYDGANMQDEADSIKEENKKLLAEEIADQVESFYNLNYPNNSFVKSAYVGALMSSMGNPEIPLRESFRRRNRSLIKESIAIGVRTSWPPQGTVDYRIGSDPGNPKTPTVDEFKITRSDGTVAKFGGYSSIQVVRGGRSLWLFDQSEGARPSSTLIKIDRSGQVEPNGKYFLSKVVLTSDMITSDDFNKLYFSGRNDNRLGYYIEGGFHYIIPSQTDTTAGSVNLTAGGTTGTYEVKSFYDVMPDSENKDQFTRVGVLKSDQNAVVCVLGSDNTDDRQNQRYYTFAGTPEGLLNGLPLMGFPEYDEIQFDMQVATIPPTEEPEPDEEEAATETEVKETSTGMSKDLSKGVRVSALVRDLVSIEYGYELLGGPEYYPIGRDHDRIAKALGRQISSRMASEGTVDEGDKKALEEEIINYYRESVAPFNHAFVFSDGTTDKQSGLADSTVRYAVIFPEVPTKENIKGNQPLVVSYSNRHVPEGLGANRLTPSFEKGDFLSLFQPFLLIIMANGAGSRYFLQQDTSTMGIPSPANLGSRNNRVSSDAVRGFERDEDTGQVTDLSGDAATAQRGLRSGIIKFISVEPRDAVWGKDPFRYAVETGDSKKAGRAVSAVYELAQIMRENRGRKLRLTVKSMGKGFNVRVTNPKSGMYLDPKRVRKNARNIKKYAEIIINSINAAIGGFAGQKNILGAEKKPNTKIHYPDYKSSYTGYLNKLGLEDVSGKKVVLGDQSRALDYSNDDLIKAFKQKREDVKGKTGNDLIKSFYAALGSGTDLGKIFKYYVTSNPTTPSDLGIKGITSYEELAQSYPKVPPVLSEKDFELVSNMLRGPIYSAGNEGRAGEKISSATFEISLTQTVNTQATRAAAENTYGAVNESDMGTLQSIAKDMIGIILSERKNNEEEEEENPFDDVEEDETQISYDREIYGDRSGLGKIETPRETGEVEEEVEEIGEELEEETEDEKVEKLEVVDETSQVTVAVRLHNRDKKLPDEDFDIIKEELKKNVQDIIDVTRSEAGGDDVRKIDIYIDYNNLPASDRRSIVYKILTREAKEDASGFGDYFDFKRNILFVAGTDPTSVSPKQLKVFERVVTDSDFTSKIVDTGAENYIDVSENTYLPPFTAEFGFLSLHSVKVNGKNTNESVYDNVSNYMDQILYDADSANFYKFNNRLYLKVKNGDQGHRRRYKARVDEILGAAASHRFMLNDPQQPLSNPSSLRFSDEEMARRKRRAEEARREQETEDETAMLVDEEEYYYNPDHPDIINEIFDSNMFIRGNKENRYYVRMNHLRPDASATGFEGLFLPVIKPDGSTWPISSPPGPRNVKGGSKFHDGVDYACYKGTPVHAIMGGNSSVNANAKGYGALVKIISPVTFSRGDKTLSVDVETNYGHMSKFNSKAIGTVASGQRIGSSGGVPGEQGSGNSQGAHLHVDMSFTVDGNEYYLYDQDLFKEFGASIPQG